MRLVFLRLGLGGACSKGVDWVLIGAMGEVYGWLGVGIGLSVEFLRLGEWWRRGLW